MKELTKKQKEKLEIEYYEDIAKEKFEEYKVKFKKINPLKYFAKLKKAIEKIKNKVDEDEKYIDFITFHEHNIDLEDSWSTLAKMNFSDVHHALWELQGAIDDLLIALRKIEDETRRTTKIKKVKFKALW